MTIARGLREAKVEAAATASSDMRHHAVEHFAAALVFVESVIEVRSQEAAALRNTKGDGALYRARRYRQLISGRVLQMRDRVAHRRRPGTGHWRTLGLVDHFVDLRRLKTGGEVHPHA